MHVAASLRLVYAAVDPDRSGTTLDDKPVYGQVKPSTVNRSRLERYQSSAYIL
jgi:hypothetical protein